MIKTTIKTFDEFQEWYRDGWKPVLGIDFETTSLDYLTMEYVGFSICNGEVSCYVDFPIQEIPRFQETMWIMHNSVFDLKCWKKFFHCEPEKIFCTLVGAKSIDENLIGKNAYSLKNLAHEWLKIPLEQIKKWEEVSNDVTSPEFIDYAMNDSIWAYQLYELEKEELRKQNLEYLFYEVEMPFQYALMDLEINGILVDKEELLSAQKEIQELLEQTLIEMCEAVNVEYWHDTGLFGDKQLRMGVNFNSSQQVIKLVEKLGFEITERTKPSKKFPKGQKSFGKEVKARLKGQHLFFDLFAKYDELENLYSSFIGPCESFIDADGRVRTSYGLKRTGRLSSSKPNLQNQPNPKKKKLIYNYRKIFIPRKGCVFVKGDWSGQELRNLAEVSKDVNMVDAFNRGFDLHLFTANRIFNLELSDKALTDNTEAHTKAVGDHKQKRHQAKNGVNFPTVYGAFAQRIAKDNGVSVAEAQRWLDEFDGLYPGVKKAVELTKRELERFGYVTTLMGRRRRFPLYKSEGKWEKARMVRQAFNMKIQGFSADQAKIAAAMVRKILPDYSAAAVLVVHDELVYEVPQEQAQNFAREIKSIMEGCVALSVPILVDISTVENYGE
jgi:DNA polymerase-1